MAGVSNFADGGIVDGSNYVGDRVPAMLNSKEMVLNQSQQSRLWNAINSGNVGGSNQGGRVEFEIRGDKLYGVLDKYNQYRSRVR